MDSSVLLICAGKFGSVPRTLNVIEASVYPRLRADTGLRSAYVLVTATSSTRRSGLEPTSTRVTSLEEIDYIDVFDFFNVPKVNDSPLAQAQTRVYSTGSPDPSVEAVAGGIGQQTMGMATGGMTGLNPGSDWMGY